jgi:hypothetical protein
MSDENVRAVPAMLWRTRGRPARVGRVEREILDAVKIVGLQMGEEQDGEA